MGSRSLYALLWVSTASFSLAGCGPAPEVSRTAGDLRVSYRQEAELFGDSGPSPVGFGGAVAVSGNLAAASAPYATVEAVHVARRHAGSWIEEARLTHPEGLPRTGFGLGLALDGHLMLVGAPWEGAVYVYQRVGLRWVLHQRLESGAAAGSQFGRAVALVEGSALVGAPAESEAGAAYVFTLGWLGFRQTARLAGSGEPGEHFGSAVALDRRLGVVGAPGEPGPGGEPSQGAVHVFRGHGHRWHREAVLCPGDASTEHGVGASVAVSHGAVVAGNDLFHPAAHVFRLTAQGWEEEAELVPDESEPTGGYGHVVAASGDTVVVGAPWDRHASTPYAGQAFVFRRTPSGWAQLELLDTDDPRSEAEAFGHAVAIDGHTVVVGAPRDDENGLDAGAAYVFRLR